MIDVEEVRQAAADVHYRREGDGWAAEATMLGFVATGTGRTLAASRGGAVEALAAAINRAWRSETPGRDRTSVVITAHIAARDHVPLPAPARSAVTRALASRKAAQTAVARSQAALADAVLALDAVGFSLRDAGQVLELSHARIAQVLEEARADTREAPP